MHNDTVLLLCFVLLLGGDIDDYTDGIGKKLEDVSMSWVFSINNQDYCCCCYWIVLVVVELCEFWEHPINLEIPIHWQVVLQHMVHTNSLHNNHHNNLPKEQNPSSSHHITLRLCLLQYVLLYVISFEDRKVILDNNQLLMIRRDISLIYIRNNTDRNKRNSLSRKISYSIDDNPEKLFTYIDQLVYNRIIPIAIDSRNSRHFAIHIVVYPHWYAIHDFYA